MSKSSISLDKIIDFYDEDDIKYLFTGELEEIKNDLELLELINYAREHSGEGYFYLPDGKGYSCDMGYVEEFLIEIEKYKSDRDIEAKKNNDIIRNKIRGDK